MVEKKEKPKTVAKTKKICCANPDCGKEMVVHIYASKVALCDKCKNDKIKLADVGAVRTSKSKLDDGEMTFYKSIADTIKVVNTDEFINIEESKNIAKEQIYLYLLGHGFKLSTKNRLYKDFGGDNKNSEIPSHRTHRISVLFTDEYPVGFMYSRPHGGSRKTDLIANHQNYTQMIPKDIRQELDPFVNTCGVFSSDKTYKLSFGGKLIDSNAVNKLILAGE